jgi:hypothetical protein
VTSAALFEREVNPDNYLIRIPIEELTRAAVAIQKQQAAFMSRRAD